MAFQGPLDIVGGSVFALSQRALASSWAGGGIITLRRSSDDAIQSFIPSSSTGLIDVAAVLAFLGSSTGYVTSWKDQSAGALNVAQATNTSQPIWNGSALGGKPTIAFTVSTLQQLGCASGFSASFNDATVFIVYKPKVFSFAGSGYIFLLGLSSALPYLSFNAVRNAGPNYLSFTSMRDSSSFYHVNTNNDANMTGSFPASIVDTVVSKAGTDDIFINGVSQASTPGVSGSTTITLTNQQVVVGGQALGGFCDNDMFLSEIIVWPSILSAANRNAIRQNMRDYYGYSAAGNPAGVTKSKNGPVSTYVSTDGVGGYVAAVVTESTIGRTTTITGSNVRDDAIKHLLNVLGQTSTGLVP